MTVSNKIRRAIRSNVLGVVAIYVALGSTALALPGKNSVDSGDIKNGAVKTADVANDGLTGADIDDSTLAVPWSGITGMPAGFADGVDNVGSGGGDATDLHCPAACIEASEIGDAQIVGSALRLPLSVSGTTDSGPLVDIQNTAGAGTRAIRGRTSGNGIGVVGSAGGVDGWGVQGTASGADGIGVEAEATGGGDAVVGRASAGSGVGRGVFGEGAYGVYGQALSTATGAGVYGRGGTGVHAEGTLLGVRASATGAGTAVHGYNGNTSQGYAGFFDGRVHINGPLSKPAGSFRIDHPLHPANKYLQHSFVESPDMKNIYDGVVTTDERGLAAVRMPGWFDALNRDFRYQLTVVGSSFARAIVWRELRDNRFVIRTNRPDTKVSWQVTGIRKDAYAKAHPIEVEVPKRGDEKGRYLAPELFGEPERKAIGRSKAVSK